MGAIRVRRRWGPQRSGARSSRPSGSRRGAAPSARSSPRPARPWSSAPATRTPTSCSSARRREPTRTARACRSWARPAGCSTRCSRRSASRAPTSSWPILSSASGTARWSSSGDGSWERIGRLVRTRYAGTVMSVDADGSLVPRRVTGWHATPLADRRVFRLSFQNAKALERRQGRDAAHRRPPGPHRARLRARSRAAADRSRRHRPGPERGGARRGLRHVARRRLDQRAVERDDVRAFRTSSSSTPSSRLSFSTS